MAYGAPSDGIFTMYGKDHRVDDHQHERLQHRPCDAEHGLLISNLDPVDGQRIEQIPVVHETSDPADQSQWREVGRAHYHERRTFPRANVEIRTVSETVRHGESHHSN